MLSKTFKGLKSCSFKQQVLDTSRKLRPLGHAASRSSRKPRLLEYVTLRSSRLSGERKNMSANHSLSTGCHTCPVATSTKNFKMNENYTQALPAGYSTQLRRPNGFEEVNEAVRYCGFTEFLELVLSHGLSFLNHANPLTR